MKLKKYVFWVLIVLLILLLVVLFYLYGVGVGERSTIAANSEQLVVLLPTAIVTPEPTAIVTPEPMVVTKLPAVFASSDLPRGDVFQSPVVCRESFNQESSWLICEPGVILDNTTAWVIPSTKDKWFVNIPEGGFTYFSMGQGIITIDDDTIKLPGEEGLNYLVVIRGRIDDVVIDVDLNETAEIIDFVPGHAIWSIMPPGAYVSKNWFEQQLEMSTTTGGTNCGATGCSRVRVVLFDVDSHFYQMFEIQSGSLNNWDLLEKN